METRIQTIVLRGSSAVALVTVLAYIVGAGVKWGA